MEMDIGEFLGPCNPPHEDLLECVAVNPLPAVWQTSYTNQTIVTEKALFAVTIVIM